MSYSRSETKIIVEKRKAVSLFVYNGKGVLRIGTLVIGQKSGGRTKVKSMVSLKRRLSTVFTMAFSTILAIMIELKLYRWCFLFYNYLVCELRLEIHEDLLLLLVLFLVFVSWILVRTFMYTINKKKSWVPKIDKAFSISTWICVFSLYFTEFAQIVECTHKPEDLELRLGPLERGEASLPSLNDLPAVVYEQGIQIPEKNLITVELKQNEMASLINKLPKEELKDVIHEDSIRKPLNAFTAEQQALLRDLAINHFSLKNKIIARMKDLYPGDAWEFTQIIREKFFEGRQKDRESSLEDLQRMLSALNKQGKSASCAKRFRSNIHYWDWK